MRTDPADARSGCRDQAGSVVVVSAATEPAGRRLVEHAARLFGPTHRYVVVAHGDGPRTVRNAVRDLDAVAVVIGVDATRPDRRAQAIASLLVRRPTCPVVLVPSSCSDGIVDEAAAQPDV